MNKKIIISLVMLTSALAFVIGGTIAFFSDTEKSVGNAFTAGAIDLLVDSEAHYNGLVCKRDGDGPYLWQPEGTQDAFRSLVAAGVLNSYPEPGTPCTGTWTERDLDGQDAVTTKFFDYRDLKPGDHGENTISLHVKNNDAYMCAIIDNMVETENGITEPEGKADDDTDLQGELASQLRFFAWDDDGDNVWEKDEQQLFSNTEGPASDVLDGVVYPMFTPANVAIKGGDTEYIGMYWCFGNIIVDDYTLKCDGEDVDNLTQTDGLTADISFVVEQARHNEKFTCPELKSDWINAVGAVNDEEASSKYRHMRHVGNPAPAGYSHAYQWGDEITCDPNNTPATFNGTIDVNSMVKGNVSFIGLLDKGLMAAGKTGYQSGAYIYVYKLNDTTIRIGPSDGNMGGEIVQVFKDYPIGDGFFDIAMTISAQKINISVDGDTAMQDDYGFVKTMNNDSAYGWNEFASGAYFGWDNFPEENYMPYNLSIGGCN